MVTGGTGTFSKNGVKIFERNGLPFSDDWAEISEMVVNADNVANTIANFNQIWLKGFLFGDINVLAIATTPDPPAKA